MSGSMREMYHLRFGEEVANCVTHGIMAREFDTKKIHEYVNKGLTKGFSFTFFAKFYAFICAILCYMCYNYIR